MHAHTHTHTHTHTHIPFEMFIGDEIDSQYHDEMEEIVQMSGTPQEALSSFNDVVKNLFQWDEHGMGVLGVVKKLK